MKRTDLEKETVEQHWAFFLSAKWFCFHVWLTDTNIDKKGPEWYHKMTTIIQRIAYPVSLV